MSARFVACPACARHVRAGQCICPFCGAKAPCAKPLRSVGERLSRAAMHAAGAAGAVFALGDCSNAQSQPGYGGSCIPDACSVYVEDTGADTTVIAEASVASDASDASSTADAEAAVDAPSDAAADVANDAPDGD
jgi:hypothetical protein